MYGKLTVVTGSMFAGKTTYLIKACSEAANPESVFVFKPAMDIRYSTSHCVSHDGDKVGAISVSAPTDLIVGDRAKLLCFDEIQFFNPPFYAGDIAQSIKVFLKAGIDVLACGLDSDWQGNPFVATGNLLAMADEVIKLKSRCAVCSDHASKTYKITKSGNQVELGNQNIYEARCNKHWAP